MSNHLLPANSTKAERALSEATARIGDLDVPLRDLWNPDTCPVELLPWLAWTFSVSVWNPRWSEEVKRQVIKQNIEVKRKLGTRGAIDAQLAALGASCDLTEWWQESPKGEPGTFDVLVWANAGLDDSEQFLSAELISDLHSAVLYAKNLRSHFSFRVGARFDGGWSVAGGGIVSRIHRRTADVTVETGLSSGIGIVGGGLVHRVHRRTGTLDISTELRADVGATGVVRAVRVHRVTMEALQ